MLNKKIDESTKRMIDNLSFEQRDSVYRYLWAEHVAADIRSRATDLKIELNDNKIEQLAERYANGEYDCNMSYWDNIDNLIEFHNM